MSGPYTVLQVLPALVAGGVERGTVEIATALTKQGHRAIVASSGGPMVREIGECGARHITLPLQTKNPFSMFVNIERLAKVIYDNNVDIVHARSRAPAWSAWLAADSTQRAFVTTFHNAYGANNWFKRRYNSVMAKGKRVIAISQFVGDYASRLYHVSPNRLRVIPRGVDIEEFDPAKVDVARLNHLRDEWRLPESVPVIMLPGRLTRWKGQLELIEALTKLGRHDVLCLIVGSGEPDYRQEIEYTASQKGYGSVVRVVEHCRDMPAALMLADVVISASNRPEGFGRVIAEAQAMGRPVIATDHGGARETVMPGKTGWLVPTNDADALAAAIDQVLYLTPEEQAEFSAQAMAHVRSRFSVTAMTDATLAVYDELMEKRKS